MHGANENVVHEFMPNERVDTWNGERRSVSVGPGGKKFWKQRYVVLVWLAWVVVCVCLCLCGCGYGGISMEAKVDCITDKENVCVKGKISQTRCVQKVDGVSQSCVEACLFQVHEELEHP